MVNLEDNKIKRVKHNLDILEDGQGGLLEICIIMRQFLFPIQKIEEMESSTSVASANFNYENLNLKIFLERNPQLTLVIILDLDWLKKIIFYSHCWRKRRRYDCARSNKTPRQYYKNTFDGKIPKDNPKFKGKDNWLPEIYQMG